MIDPRLANSPTLRLARRTFVRPLVERRLNPGIANADQVFTVTTHDPASNLAPLRALRWELLKRLNLSANWDSAVNRLHAATAPAEFLRSNALWIELPLIPLSNKREGKTDLWEALHKAGSKNVAAGVVLRGRRGSGKTGLLEKCWLDSLSSQAAGHHQIPVWLSHVAFSVFEPSAHYDPAFLTVRALAQAIGDATDQRKRVSEQALISWLKNSPPLLLLCDTSHLDSTPKRQEVLKSLSAFQKTYGAYGHQCVVTTNAGHDDEITHGLQDPFVVYDVGNPTWLRDDIIEYPNAYDGYLRGVESKLDENLESRFLSPRKATGTSARIAPEQAAKILERLWPAVEGDYQHDLRRGDSSIGTPLLMFAATQLPPGCSEQINNELDLLKLWRQRLARADGADAPSAQSTVAMLDSILGSFEEHTSTVQARPERPSQISVPTFLTEPTPPPQQVSPVPESVDAPFIRPIVARPPVKKQTSPLIRALALICMLLPVAIAMVDSPWRARPTTPPRARTPQTPPNPPPTLESPPRFDTAPIVPSPNGFEPPQPVISRPPTPQISLAFHRGSPFGDLDSPDSQQDQLSKPYEYLQPAKLLIEQGLAYEGAGAEVLSGIEHTGTQLWYCDSSISQSKLPRQLECRFTDHTKHEPAQNQRWLLLLAVHPTKREWRLVKGEFQSKAGEGKSGTEYVVGFNTLSLRDWLLAPNDDNLRLALWLFYNDPQPDIERLHVCETPY